MSATVPTRPLRVMHVLLKLGFGGAEGGVVKLVNRHDRSRVEPSITSCWPADGLQDQLRADVRLHQLNRKRIGNDPLFAWTLSRLLRREQPDVLHTHGWATLCEGAAAARLAGVPLVVHGEHGTLETKPHQVFIQRIVWPRLDAITSVSSRLTEKLAATVGYPSDRIVTIRNGVDTARFTPERRAAGRAALGLSEESLAIGAVGRLLPVKDHVTLVAALVSLRARGLRFDAVLVGDGPLRDQLTESLRGHGLDRCVRLLGNRPDVECIMAGLDIFVQSSLSEGLSNTVLEAMSTGVPVVATDVGGTDELVVPDVTGLLVPASNAAALADAVHALAVDAPRRLAMGRAARSKAESEFTLARMTQGYENLYFRLASREPLVASAGRPHPEGGR